MTKGIAGIFERGRFAPFLLAAQPILQLYLINVEELSFTEILRALIVSILFASSSIWALNLFLKDRIKASLVASLLIFFFFLFGDVSRWVSAAFGLGPARSDFVVFLVAIVLVATWFWIVRAKLKNTSGVNLYFNLLSILVLLNTGIQVRNHLRENPISYNPSNRPLPVAEVQTDSPRPDIYYIVLDGYGREDILRALYNFDNSEFIGALEARGFYVADQSSSNYIQTMLSLGSSFNMDYLQTLSVNGKPLENRADLIEILNYSSVRLTLADKGYRTISFENEYKATIPSADIYYDDGGSAFTEPVTAFESIVIDHSLARVLNYIPAFRRALIEMPYETHRRYILSTFSQLQETPALDGDYFVYAHIIAPHPPFVFDEDGNVIMQGEPFTLFDANFYISDHSRGGYIGGYRKQIQYINTLVLETVDAILQKSDVPPIIILQGDHGPGAYLHWGSLEQTIPAERFGILNAYYFPDQNYASLYPTISPVNSFRLVLLQYFNADMALLPDRHYYSFWSLPFDLQEVTDLSLPK